MGRRLEVDRALCFGTGLCAATAPGLFTLGADHVAAARTGELTDPAEIALAEEVAECCPREAISLRPE
ncbi:ferredoxin [Herbidospora galbida]|uniref:Ferredoxin n=1 Tax=Herbidospora galbida TaxID=2575442 RepID=A0A4U3MGN3_9ACTN|nr:ferredoxin [Herbidospora galbida]TKK87960.1 ferredoxin [Herbidospora galbida]